MFARLDWLSTQPRDHVLDLAAMRVVHLDRWRWLDTITPQVDGARWSRPAGAIQLSD